MNNNNLLELLQQSFRIGVGATTSVLETLQDPQKRSETLSDLQNQLTQQFQEWSDKGEVTEQEARRVVDQWLNQKQETTNKASTSGHNNAESSPSPTSRGKVQGEIQQLTEQVITLRQELEKSRQSKS
ncbi:MAG TPA: hypothetical protein DCF68_19555 [Cyanothece sp. UBA12306]|nr:hypothetical protein [Cyanothece sp. UBA12306]